MDTTINLTIGNLAPVSVKVGSTSTVANVSLSNAAFIVKDSVPQIPSDWNQTNTSSPDYIKNKPALGTAAALNVGTSANNVVQLDSNAKLPAVDGSQLTNLSKEQVGLSNVDNTSDSNKPVSTAQAAADAAVLAAADAYTDSNISAYASAEAILNTALTGLNTALAGNVTSADTILSAIGKITYTLSRLKQTFKTVGSTAQGFTASDVDYLCTGTNDDVVFQQILADSLAAGGFACFLHAGIYFFSSFATIMKDANIAFIAEKATKKSTSTGTRGGVMIQASSSISTSSPIDALFKSQGDSFVYDDGTGNTSNLSTGPGQFFNVVLNGNNRVKIPFDCLNVDSPIFCGAKILNGTQRAVRSLYNGVGSDGSQAIPGGLLPGGLRFSDCILSAPSGIDVELEYNTQCWFHNCWEEGGSSNPQTHVRLKSCVKVYFTGVNEFDPCSVGAIQLEDESNNPCFQLQFYGQFVTGSNLIPVVNDLRTNNNSVSLLLIGNIATGSIDETILKNPATNIILTNKSSSYLTTSNTLSQTRQGELRINNNTTLGSANIPAARAWVDGSFGINAKPVNNSQSPYTLGATDGVLLVDATAGPVSLVLPTVSGRKGRYVIVYRTDTTTNAITFTPNGSETINGLSTLSIPTTQYYGVVPIRRNEQMAN
jgi:hypothetical protein